MTRVPVPDDYDDRDVPLPEEASSLDYESRAEVVGTPGRVAQVREDSEGQYVGVPEQYAAAVADYLGVTLDDAPADGSAGETAGENDDESDDDAVDYSDVQDAIDSGRCPWCGDAYEGVPQHASSAHPEEWQAYKEANES